MKKHKENILRLRTEGKTYDEIQKILGCSKSTISFHCGENQKIKHNIRNRKYRSTCGPIKERLSFFLSRKAYISKYHEIPTKFMNFEKLIMRKIYQFNINNTNNCLDLQDVINKIGKNPKCYLTGREIDLTNSKSFHFDHIIPVSKGGENILDNLGIACREANLSKHNLTLSEFLQLCEDVLINFGYKVIKPSNGN